MSAPKEPTVAQQLVGDFAPKLAQLTDDVRFGDVWERAKLQAQACPEGSPFTREEAGQ